MLETGALIVGAGVVGLSVAAELARRRQVVVLERRRSFGLETSSRSSEVIHAGLYYRPGSLKARLCVEGAALALERCQRLGVPLASRGKLIIAREAAQEEALWALHRNALACGAEGLERWPRARLKREAPELPAIAALHSARTAVVDSHELMRSIVVEVRELGGELAYRHSLVGLAHDGERWRAEVLDPDGERLEVRAPLVINAAGLASDAVAAMAGIDLDEAGYRLFPCKGDYFLLSGRASRGLDRLIYPLPETELTGLGVHLTVDVGGQARLGPDATYPTPGEPLDHRVDEAKLPAFLSAGRRLIPRLEASDLSPDRSGLRPKLSGPGEPARDFVLCHEKERGLPGLVNLIGIESPGLTAALAIGREVRLALERDGAL